MAAAGFHTPAYNQLLHALGLSEAVGTLSEAPAVYQTAEASVPQNNYMDLALGLDEFRASDLNTTQHIEPVDCTHEEDVPRDPGLELNFGTYEAATGSQECQHHSGETPSVDNIVEERDILVFPEGEDDAVTIFRSDLEGLQPARRLSNNIIDFYIKFLKRRLSLEDKERFYFFSSFFFTKMMGGSRSNAEIHVDFDGVRGWTREVNLFEKDYVFIPILRSSHWSLIIVRHLNDLTNSRDKRRGSPCVYHLDPIEGQHESFEDQIKSYMIQACIERYQDSNDRNQIILALACEMKYIRSKVPQLDNGHDCGVYLLHYVEVFLRESNSPCFNFSSTSYIWGPDFAEGATSKRCHIQSLISELSTNPYGQLRRPMDIEPRPHARASDAPNPYAGRKCSPKPRNLSQSNLSKKWKPDETSLLLKRMMEDGRIRKGTKGATHWELISQDIKTKLGFSRAADECRRRYDTLLKAYKKVEKTGKSFCDITEKEQVELNLATPLTDEWCGAIQTICQPKSATAKSRKRRKHSPDGGDDMPSRNLAPPPILSESPARETPSLKQVAMPEFNNLREDLKITLLNLIQLLSVFLNWTTLKVEYVCRVLAIVEDREPWDIRRNIYELSELKLVDLVQGGNWDEKTDELQMDRLGVVEEISKKVLCENPDLVITLKLWENDGFVSIPEEPALLSLQQIRVLDVYECSALKEVDLSCFPELRFLSINCCHALTLVTGWEVLSKLGYLEIGECRSYVDFPLVQHLPSLRVCRLRELYSVPDDFGQCVGLRQLEICGIESSAMNKMDLSMLRFLEGLIFRSCDALTSIQGLSGLHSLTSLDLAGCGGLKGVPGLGCLKALTCLDMTWSGVEDISGVQELHSLTTLLLGGCGSLKELPFLGHLKALAFLSVSNTSVEEIPGVRYLVSLESLYCCYSEVKWLPDLHHLPHLQKVSVKNTPLSEVESSLVYFGKDEVHFGSSKALF